MHNEQLAQFWKKYKILVYIIVVLLVLFVAGMEAYKAHRLTVLTSNSDTYEQAVILNAKGQTEEALATYEKLQNAGTNYKYLSMLRRAGILFEQEKKQEALSLLRNVYEDKSAPNVLQTIAIFGFVSQQIDTMDTTQAHNMIAPYLVASNPYYGTAVELEIILLIKQNKKPEAVSLIDQALTVTSVSQEAKQRLSVIKQGLTDK